MTTTAPLTSEPAAVQPLAEAPDGVPVRVGGQVGAIIIAPLGGSPTLEAELEDGTGRVVLIWLGRRRVGGIDPGRRLIARGRLATSGGRRIMFNPQYELLP